MPRSGTRRRRNNAGVRKYPICKSKGCHKFSQGKGFCRAHERKLPVGPDLAIRQEYDKKAEAGQHLDRASGKHALEVNTCELLEQNFELSFLLQWE